MKPLNRHLKVVVVNDEAQPEDDMSLVLPTGYTVDKPWTTATVVGVSDDCTRSDLEGATVVFQTNMLVDVNVGTETHSFVQENYIVCYDK